MSKKASSITSRNSDSNALNGLKKRQSHLICNWLPLSSFHHQFLDRDARFRPFPESSSVQYCDFARLQTASPPNNKTNNIQRHPGISITAYSLRILSDKAFPGSCWT